MKRKGRRGKVFNFDQKVSAKVLLQEMNIRRSKALKIPLEPTTPKKCEHKPEVQENPDVSLSQRSKCSH
jgi:hypothetical protein